jgi:hypothetical protein
MKTPSIVGDEKEMKIRERSKGAEDNVGTSWVVLVLNRPRCGAGGGGEVVSRQRIDRLERSVGSY